MGANCCAPKAAPGEVAQDKAQAVLSNVSIDLSMLRFLSKVQLFKNFPQDQHPVLAAACIREDHPQGHVLIRQGDDGDAFFVIISGEVSVDIDGTKVATLSVGDYVGEAALVHNQVRAATITAETPISILKITRDKFRELGLNEKLEFAKRQAVGGGAARKIVTKPAVSKNEHQYRLIADAIKSNQHLCTMMDVTDDKIRQLVNVAWVEKVKKGKDIITEGDLEADYFYIVKDGSFEVLVTKNVQDADKIIATERLGTVDVGGSFGERALLYYAPRAATVRAKETAHVYVIDRNNFKSILAKSAEDIALEHKTYIDKVEILKGLKDDERMEVARVLLESRFSAGETIFEQDTPGREFYILYEGEVAVIQNGREVARKTAGEQQVEFFGEMALLSNSKRNATIKVISQEAKTLSMDKTSFDMLLGPLEELKKRGSVMGESMVSTKSMKLKPEGKEQTKCSVAFEDLTVLGLLGCGGFGTVELVEESKTKDVYALKGISKGYVVKGGMQKSILREKDIQIMLDSPFIVKLFKTFNSKQNLYFLLEVALGGDLFEAYARKGFHGSEKHARFYIASTVFAFENLHEKKVIYRDLKPENLLLNAQGTMKVTDMGLAKVSVGKTFTSCGTPDYFAPELIMSSGHTHSVDWWTLGIFTYELMSGNTPFESRTQMETFKKVIAGIKKVRFPSRIKGPLKELIQGLCEHDPPKRLPMRKGGTENIKGHIWFRGFDWDRLQNLEMPPPYKPPVKSNTDMENFSASRANMPPQLEYVDIGDGWDKDF